MYPPVVRCQCQQREHTWKLPYTTRFLNIKQDLDLVMSGSTPISVENEIALEVDRLRRARERLGISQRELARRCGISEPLISKYENGQIDPSSTNIRHIAEILEVSIDYLLGLTDEPRGHLGDGELQDDERAVLEAYRRAGWSGIARLMADALEKS